MLKFRQLDQNDFLDILDCCYSGFSQPRLFADLNRSLQRQARGNSVHLLAFWNDHLVGTAQLIRQGGKSEIAEVVVAHNFRRRGVGTIMVNHLQELAGKKNWLPVEIVVRANNPRARALYERLGFCFKRSISIPTNEPADLLQWPGPLPIPHDPNTSPNF